jgi:hypothetical protein
MCFRLAQKQTTIFWLRACICSACMTLDSDVFEGSVMAPSFVLAVPNAASAAQKVVVKAAKAKKDGRETLRNDSHLCNKMCDIIASHKLGSKNSFNEKFCT